MRQEAPELISDLMCQPDALRRQLIGHAIPSAQLYELGIGPIQSSQKFEKVWEASASTGAFRRSSRLAKPITAADGVVEAAVARIRLAIMQQIR